VDDRLKTVLLDFFFIDADPDRDKHYHEQKADAG
jgi:hypothetical protein